MTETAIRLTDAEYVEVLERLIQAKMDKDVIEERIQVYNGMLKGHLAAIGADELTQAGFIVSNKLVTTETIDAKAFRAELPEVAARYTRTKEGRRFIVRAIA